MFEVPGAKRVRREDLHDSSSEASDDEGSAANGLSRAEKSAALQAALKARFASSLEDFLSAPLGGSDGAGGDQNSRQPPPGSRQHVAASTSHTSAPTTITTATPEDRVSHEDSDSDSEGRSSSSPQTGDEGKEEAKEHAGELEFEFRLFSTAATSSSAAAAAPKVILVPQETHDPMAVDDAAGGFVVPRRPLSHYLAVSGPTPEEAERFRLAAVEGADVVRRSRHRAWGLELPWRVTRVAVSKKALRALLGASGLQQSAGGADIVGGDEAAAPQGEEGRRAAKRRPGKKRRIAMRVREKARRDKEAELAKLKMSKEEHLKEKKKRLNRVKKLRRRGKKRTAGEAGEGDDDDDEGASRVSGEAA